MFIDAGDKAAAQNVFQQSAVLDRIADKNHSQEQGITYQEPFVRLDQRGYAAAAA